MRRALSVSAGAHRARVRLQRWGDHGAVATQTVIATPLLLLLLLLIV